MPADPLHSPPAALGLSYDELPEGSVLRREYDGRGGVTITAPAGELPAAVRRAAARTALLPAVVVLVICTLAIGFGVLYLARRNQIEPALREVAAIALAVLLLGVFLFEWLRQYMALRDEMLSARRYASVLHADADRLLLETTGDPARRSLDLPTASIRSLEVEPAAFSLRQGRRLPCLRLLLRDGSDHLLLGGHHDAELRWVAATLSGVTDVPVLSDASGR